MVPTRKEKTAPKKATPKKTASKKAISKKAAPKKAAPKKTPLPKKSASKGTVEENAVGQYDIECSDISEGWDNCDELSLRICSVKGADGSPKLVGSFDFGVLEGIMHLGRDLATLPHSNISGGAGSSDEEDESEDEEDEEDLAPATSSTTTKRKAVAEPKGGASKKRGRPSKKAVLNFLWRGRETGEGEIQRDHDRSNRGSITFKSDSCAEFTGAMNMSFVGQNVSIKGSKASDTCEPINDNWNNYSERRYEKARVARWH